MQPAEIRASLIALVVCVTAGCASLQPTPHAAPAAGSTADAFGFSGRIAVQEQDRNQSGGIRWSHDSAGDNILLLSPLGQGVMQIETGAEGATLRTADEKFYRAADAEQLAWNVTGWRIPVAALVYWVRGMAQPGDVSLAERDGQGRLLRLKQADWQIEYTQYFDAPDAALPRRMVLKRPEFELKLVVDNWEHPADGTAGSPSKPQ
jgi:outer membrane lipoprotein LolB